MGYAKLFSSLLASSLMGEDIRTRWLFVAMLAMADRDGIVEASLPGLAHIARLTLPECEKALDVLGKPDEHSRSKAHDGRRIERIDGGWRVINYEEYRDKATPEEYREKGRRRQERWRERQQVSRRVTSRNVTSRLSRSVTYSEAEAEAGTERRAAARDRVPAIAARPEDVEPELWAAFLANRKAKKKPLTPRAWALMEGRIRAAGTTATAALTEAVARGWADWGPGWASSGGAVPTKRPQAVEHIRNAPLGTAACGCVACEDHRARRTGA